MTWEQEPEIDDCTEGQNVRLTNMFLSPLVVSLEDHGFLWMTSRRNFMRPMFLLLEPEPYFE